MVKDHNDILVSMPTCHLSRIFRKGKEFVPGEHAPGEMRTSGWLNHRIDAWVKEHQHCPNVNFGVLA